ncbi:unnamed protein product [Brassica oleracea var. botrytis]|uniref:(rape) hypothetical protein n=1 Tax=Brassica napus TaxID=3708 RepID=A0A816UAJ7_BRANA|nr:unnamed protein product [Brassica napus]
MPTQTSTLLLQLPLRRLPSKSGKTLEITKTYDDKGKETWDNGQIDITKASGKCNLSLVVP